MRGKLVEWCARDCVARIVCRQGAGDLSRVLKPHTDTEPIENQRFGDAGIGENAKPGSADEAGSPIFGVKIPDGYRQWELIAVAYESGLDELRRILGNALSMRADRQANSAIPCSGMMLKTIAALNAVIDGKMW